MKQKSDRDINDLLKQVRLAHGVRELEPWEQKEIEGRDKFMFFCTAHPSCTNFEAMDASADYDVTYFWDGTLKRGEIKQRRKKSTDYNEWMLEEYKYSKLLKYNGDIDYINLYDDGQVAIFDLRKVDNRVVYKVNLPKTNDNFNNKRDKCIIYLPISTSRYKSF